MQDNPLLEYFMSAIKDNYANFSGRARRREFWGFILFYVIIYMTLSIVSVLIYEQLVTIVGLFALAVFIPNLAVSVRRLHDIGKSGWFLLVGFIPLIGGIWLLILLCTDSDAGINEYGPNPKDPDFGAEVDQIGTE